MGLHVLELIHCFVDCQQRATGLLELLIPDGPLRVDIAPRRRLATVLELPG